MNILIIYATYSTGTLSVAEKAQELLQGMGHTVRVLRADKVQGADLMEPELIIMGSPSWKVMGKEGMPHEFYFAMMDRLAGQSFQKKFALFALGDDSYAEVCGAANHLLEFVPKLGGTLVGEPLRIEGFYFNQSKRLKELKAWLEVIGQ